MENIYKPAIIRKIKAFCYLNILIFGSFLFLEVIHFLFYYSELTNIITETYPCWAIERFVHYMLSVGILFGSLSFLVSKKLLVNMIAVPLTGFLAYLLSLVALVLSRSWYPCFMSWPEEFMVIYIYSIIQFSSLFKTYTEDKLKRKLMLLLYFFLFFLFFMLQFIYLQAFYHKILFGF